MWNDDNNFDFDAEELASQTKKDVEKSAPQTVTATPHDGGSVPSARALSTIKSPTYPQLSTPTSTFSTHSSSVPAHGGSGGLSSLFSRKTTETSLTVETGLSPKIMLSSTPKSAEPSKKTLHSGVFDLEGFSDEENEATKFDSDTSDGEHSDELSETETAEQNGANISTLTTSAPSPSSFTRPNSQPRLIQHSPWHPAAYSPPKDETSADVSKSAYFRGIFGIPQPTQSSFTVEKTGELSTTPVITRTPSPP